MGWIERLGTGKTAILLSLVLRSDAAPIEPPGGYFVDINKLMLMFVWREKRPRMAEAVLKEKNAVRGPRADIETDCKGTAIKAM